MTDVEMEHSIRDYIRIQIAWFDRLVADLGEQHLTASISYDHSRSDGMWHIYTYVAGNSVDTRGAVLSNTMYRHIEGIKGQLGNSKLPSLLAPPSNYNTPVLTGEAEQD